VHWLVDLFLELLSLIAPGRSPSSDRSVVGESRMDRNARRFGILLLVILALVIGGWLYLRA
jgi:hypothetical protein